MKKMISFLLIFMLLIPYLSGCGLKSDGQLARNNLEKLVYCIEKTDYPAIENLFAPNVKNDLNDLDVKIIELCAYYMGKVESISGGIGSETEMDNFKEVRVIFMLYEISTSEDHYYFSILWCVKDDYDSNNIGIWSLFVERFDGNTPQTTITSWDKGITLR